MEVWIYLFFTSSHPYRNCIFHCLWMKKKTPKKSRITDSFSSFLSLHSTFVALVLNCCESLVIELQRKARLHSLLMSAIQLELKLHYISTIDPGAAGIWAVIINDVTAVMDNSWSAINHSNEMMDFIHLLIYFEFQQDFAAALCCLICFEWLYLLTSLYLILS